MFRVLDGKFDPSKRQIWEQFKLYLTLTAINSDILNACNEAKIVDLHPLGETVAIIDLFI